MSHEHTHEAPHEHEHSRGGETHTHSHVHEAGVEEFHEHTYQASERVGRPTRARE